MATFYGGTTFVCMDKSATLPCEAVNDDYCDCLDGSDEPGTAACPNGRFYCRNLGYLPQRLSAEFVDDGVCDCCDGSDEKSGDCENTCMVLGEGLRAELKKRHENYESALREKSTRLKDTDSIAETWRAELATCLTEIDQQKVRCAELQQNVSALEETEQQQKEQTNTSETAENQTDPSNDATEETTETDEEDDDESEIEEDEDNDQDEGVGVYDAEDETQDDPEDGKSAEATSVEEDPSEASSPSFIQGMKDRIRRFFFSGNDKEKASKIPASSRRGAEAETALTKLRREHANNKKELQSLENKRDALQSKIDRDYGPESKFISLVDKCFQLQQDKYSYEICPFDKASQKERHSTVNLGRYERFGELYAWMEFHHGQVCAHGKSRSLTVYFQCGQEDGIDSVTEPDMCEYAANFSTPVACSESELEMIKKEVDLLGLPIKDEL